MKHRHSAGHAVSVYDFFALTHTHTHTHGECPGPASRRLCMVVAARRVMLQRPLRGSLASTPRAVRGRVMNNGGGATGAKNEHLSIGYHASLSVPDRAPSDDAHNTWTESLFIFNIFFLFIRCVFFLQKDFFFCIMHSIMYRFNRIINHTVYNFVIYYIVFSFSTWLILYFCMQKIDWLIDWTEFVDPKRGFYIDRCSMSINVYWLGQVPTSLR